MKRILLIILTAIFVNTVYSQQYAKDAVCESNDGNVAVITSSGFSGKKKDVYNEALKSIFNALFFDGIQGVQNGKPLVTKKNDYYIRQFFSTRYFFFINGYDEIGKPEKQPTGLYKGGVKANVLLGALIKDLISNNLMDKPLDQTSMEDVQEQIPLPSIMVVPYKSSLNTTYASILRNDFDLRMAVSAVDNGFKQLGVNTINVEGRTNATMRSSEWESDNADSNDRQLLLNSGADVYVVVDLQKDINTSGSRVSLIMSAHETSTGRNLASRKGWTNRFKTSDIDKLCAYAVDDVLEGFLKDISIEFAKKLTAGNVIALRIGLSSDAYTTDLNTRIPEKNITISALVRNWVRSNAQNGRYHIQGAVAESLVFDTVNIPAVDADGLSMDAFTFADNLKMYLEDNGVPCEVRVDGLTVYVTVGDIF